MTAVRALRRNSRLSDTEALMWSIDRDPSLRSSFLNVTFLDRAPDFARFVRRMERAVVAVPRLQQRIAPATLRPVPDWEEDPDFELAYHVRRVALPEPGTDRQLLDAAALSYQDAFDPLRPLWQLTIVEGLSGGRAALLAKFHHTVTDGVGGIRLSTMFLDLERDADAAMGLEPEAVEADGGVMGALGGALRGGVDVARRVVGDAVDTVRDPVGTVQSAARQFLVTDQARSPLWRGRRSGGRHFDVLSVSLDDARRTAHALDATINDVYVAGVAGGVAAYHRAKGVEVDDLRMAMPISTRSDKSMAGNAFIPSRALVPAGISDPVERVRAVHERLSAVKSERSLGIVEPLAGLLTTLPAPLLVRLARSQIETVDFACSNLRGAPFDLYVAGAMVLSNHPMGPTLGTPFNCTLMSYRSAMDIGINADTAAIDDPQLLTDCIAADLEEVLTATP